MKKICRYSLVLAAVVAVLITVIATSANIHNAYADEPLSSEKIDVIKRNAMYKTIYGNLEKCYASMQQVITEDREGIRASFNSSVYFTEDALDSNFLTFPYIPNDSVFSLGKERTSCPELITGWKTSWFTKLTMGQESYDGLLGINADATVPEESYLNSGDNKMGEFLTSIGYTATSDNSNYGDRKCFYFKVKFSDKAKGMVDAIELAGSNDTFETVDYCVKVDADGKIPYDSDAIIALTGNNDYFDSEYDQGHLNDTSNVVWIPFENDGATSPQFVQYKYQDSNFNKWYLSANTTGQLLITLGSGNTSLPMRSLEIKNVSSKDQAVDSNYYGSLGYIVADWYRFAGPFQSVHYIASLTNYDEKISLTTFQNRLRNMLQKMRINDDSGDYLVFSSVTMESYTPGQKKFTKSASSQKFIEHFLKDVSKYNGGKFSDAEIYMLGYSYLKNTYNVEKLETNTVESAVRIPWLNDDGTFTYYYVYDPDDSNHLSEMPDSDTNVWTGRTLSTWEGIASRLAGIDVATAFSADVIGDILDPDLNPDGDDNENVATPVDLCLQNAGALGWIMCPILNFVGNTVSQQYESISEQWLDIPAHTLASDSGVHTGWSQFRDIANIGFIIVILVVVLSQVTGIGLTNYSIKKMLPTIIVMAVLVNMSFIICQLAVDISNIAGNAIYNLFHEVMAKPVFAGAAVDYGFAKVFASIMSFISVTVVVTGGITIASGNIGAWLIPILLAAISAAFSIFFFFMVLAIRQAGVLILVVVSPLAIICYALPNTKSFFDRWKKLFVSLLMVYPICGALMGGSYFASGLLLSTNKGIMFCLVAMLLQVVPFFMIPSLVRGSLAVAGNIGTKVANFGRGLSKQTGGAFAKSETAKRLNASANRLGAKNAQGQRRALKGINSKLRGAPLIGGALSRIEDSRIGKAISGTYNRSVDRQSARAAVNWDKMIHEDAAAEVLSHQDYIEPGSEDYQRLVDSEQRQRISKMAKNVEEANSNISSDTTALKTAHASALSALETNQTDQNLATVEALQNMLAISDGGREALYDNLAESAVRGDTTGLELASQHLLREHTKNIKPNSRDLFSLLGDASSISHNPSALQRNSFAQYTTGEGANQKTHYNSTHYANKGIGSYDAQSMAKMDETSLDRLIQQARSGGIADAKDRALLEEYTREAITNDNIQVQGKIANKFNDLRYALGYQKINKKDSGILPARGAMPSGFEERQSGIIVPRNGRELSNSELRNLQKEEQKRINQQ